MNTDFDVQYVAQLARLDLTPDEAAKFQSQLGGILDFVEKLRAVDVTGIEPTAHTFAQTNVFRADEAREGLGASNALANAPRAVNDLFIVPKVIE